MFSITEQAAAKISRLYNKHYGDAWGLRVGVRGGGCTGFEYVFEWITEKPQETGVCSMAAMVPVFCDMKSLDFLAGATLDYQKTLMRSEFFWDNPNQKSACGCGKSVSF